MSTTLQIELADDVCAAMHKDPPDFVAEMRLAAAVKWYEMGVVSQDKAAQVAGLSRSEFLLALSRFGVSPFQETGAEILRGL